MQNKKRFDYVMNETKILQTLKMLLKQKNTVPSVKEISAVSGVNLRTVHRHLKNLKTENYISELRLLTGEVLVALYEKAKEGKAPEVKLWMQLVENWREKQEIDHSGKIKFEKINFVLAEPGNSEIQNEKYG